MRSTGWRQVLRAGGLPSRRGKIIGGFSMTNGIRRRVSFKLLMSLLFLSFLRFPASAGEGRESPTFDENQLKTAIKEYKAAIKKNPGDEGAYLGLIQAHRAFYKSKDAREVLTQALKRLPDSVWLHIVSGDLYFQEASIEEAEESYRKAVQLDAKNARGYFGLFKVNLFSFNRKAALEMIRLAYEYDPRDNEIAEAYALEFLSMAQRWRLQEKFPQLWRMTNPPEKAEIRFEMVTRSPRMLGPVVLMAAAPTGTVIRDTDGTFRAPTIGETLSARSELVRDVEPAYASFTVQAVIFGKQGQRKITLELRDALEFKGGVVLTRKSANELNLDIVNGNPGLAMADKLQIGPFEFQDCLMQVADWDLRAEIDGTIGLDMFERYLVTVDLPNYVLRLNPLPRLDGQPFEGPDSWREMDRRIPDELKSFTLLGLQKRHVVIQGNVSRRLYGYFALSAVTNNYCISWKSPVGFNTAIAGIFKANIRRCPVPRSRALRPDAFYMDTIGILDFELLKETLNNSTISYLNPKIFQIQKSG